MADKDLHKAHGAILDIAGKDACAKIAERLEAGECIPVIIRGYITSPWSDMDDQNFEDGMQSFDLKNVTFEEVPSSDLDKFASLPNEVES